MPQETKAKDAQGGRGESDAGGEVTLQGTVVEASDHETLADALEKAFDYRGDVTLRLRGGETVEGYIFDRRRGATLGESSLRLMTAASDEPVRVRYSDIAAVEFSGKDAAHGRSFETWVKKYVEKKLRGEKATIESEPLGD